MDLSISIVNFNTCDMLRECLTRLRASASGRAVEIIVVDNGSSDGSAELVRREFPEVGLIENAINRYFTAAHNQALRVSTGRYVLILNSDILVFPDTLPRLVEFMDTHPEAGAVGCLLLDAAEKPTRSCWRFPDLKSALLGHKVGVLLFPNSRVRRNYEMLDWDGLSEREVEVVMDSFICLRRETLNQINGYDEAMLMYYTEQDLCLSVKKAGWKVLFTPSIRAVHLHQYTSNRVNPWRIWSIRKRDTVAYFKKHHGILPAAVLNAIWSVDMMIRVPTQYVARLMRGSTR
jgi:GT2 family glycosyltransferase